MRYLFFCLMAICFFTWNCTFISKTIYGAKKPKTESKESIEAWMEKNGFKSVENVISINAESFYDFFRFNNNPPLLFDSRSGKFLAIGYSNGRFCPRNVDEVIATIYPYSYLNPKPDYFIISEYSVFPQNIEPEKIGKKDLNNLQRQIDTTFLNLFDISRSFYSLDGKQFSLNRINTDYVLILPFTLYMGSRFQVQDLKKYYHAAILNKNAKMKVLFLNLDKQEWWGKEWNEKIQVGF